VREPSSVHGKNPITKTQAMRQPDEQKNRPAFLSTNTENFDDCVTYNTAGDFYLRTVDVSESKIHCDVLQK